MENIQINLEKLKVLDAQEEGHFWDDGDEPYLVVLGFRSRFNTPGSTQVFWSEYLDKVGDGLDDGAERYIPPSMGSISFSNVKRLTQNELLLGNKPEVLGAIVIALEHDKTSFGDMRGLLNKVRSSAEAKLRELVEQRDINPSNIGDFGNIVENAKIDFNLSLWEKIKIFFKSFLNPDDLIDRNLLLYAAIDPDLASYSPISALPPTNQEFTINLSGDGATYEVTTSFKSDAQYGDSSNNTLYGTNGNDILDGRGGNDTLFGWDGNDYLFGGNGNDFVYGDGGNDTLYGWTGSDTLDGRDGNDVIYGEDDNDYLFGGNGNDFVYGDGGNDTLYGWTGSDTLDGRDGNDVIYGEDDNDYLFGGNGNDFVYGDGGNDTLYGWTGSDTLDGRDGNDVIYGEDDNDYLFGGVGNDTLYGGDGNDILYGDYSQSYIYQGHTYLLTTSATWEDAQAEAQRLGGNLVTINNAAEQQWISSTFGTSERFWIGLTDKQTEGTFQWISGELFAYKNWLPGDPNNWTGAEPEGEDNVIINYIGGNPKWVDIGKLSNGTIISFRGIIEVPTASLNPTLSGNDSLNGGTGDDTLLGGAGNDTLNGGTGNDVYWVQDTGDVITETSTVATEVDTVYSPISYTLGANLENLTLTGTAAINGTGNTRNNTIFGNNSNNTLNGGAGNDTLRGGGGNDIYEIDRLTDVIIENLNEGIDTVQSPISYTLGDNLENLNLTGAAALNGTGNSLKNIIAGNSANNTLTGGEGADTINGGAGIDRLVETTELSNFILTNTSLTTTGRYTQYRATNASLTIPDSGTTTSIIPVGGLDGKITDVNVTLNIFHPYVSDLDVFLISPSGTRVELFTDVGGSGDNFSNTILDDETATSIASATAPFTGTFRPEGLLSTFDGENPNGGWRLEITDDAGANVGTLYTWALSFAPPTATVDQLNSIEQVSLTAGNGDNDNIFNASAFSLGGVTLDGGVRNDTLTGGSGDDLLTGGNDYTFPSYVYKGHTYFLSFTYYWEEAQAHAQSFGGNLVTINDAAEQTWLTNTFGADKLYWIGFTDQQSEGNWQWISGEPVTYDPAPWSAYEPNDAGGNEDYAVMGWGNNAWNDLGRLGLGGLGFQGIIEVPSPSFRPQIVGNDSLTGGAGNDTLIGGGGNDILNGGIGNDSINGGTGNDLSYGGAGSDTFYYSGLADAGDTIADFLTGGTIDKINLQASGFAGLIKGQLQNKQYGEGATLKTASTAAFTANGNKNTAAILAVTLGSSVQIYYDRLASNTTLGGETLLATLSNQSTANINQTHFAIV